MNPTLIVSILMFTVLGVFGIITMVLLDKISTQLRDLLFSKTFEKIQTNRQQSNDNPLSIKQERVEPISNSSTWKKGDMLVAIKDSDTSSYKIGKKCIFLSFSDEKFSNVNHYTEDNKWVRGLFVSENFQKLDKSIFVGKVDDIVLIKDFCGRDCLGKISKAESFEEYEISFFRNEKEVNSKLKSMGRKTATISHDKLQHIDHTTEFEFDPKKNERVVGLQSASCGREGELLGWIWKEDKRFGVVRFDDGKIEEFGLDDLISVADFRNRCNVYVPKVEQEKANQNSNLDITILELMEEMIVDLEKQLKNMEDSK